METYLWITCVWGIYLTAIVFFGDGVADYEWSTTPKSHVRLACSPSPRRHRGSKQLADTFIARIG